MSWCPGWEHVGRAMREARRARGIGRKQLVEKLGYRNVNKGLRRLDELEAGSLEPSFFHEACDALAPDPKELAAAFGRDRAEQEAWLDEPVPIEFAIKWMPCVFQSVPLPEEARHDPEAAEAFAIEVARDKARQVPQVEGWLTLDRRRTMIIEGTGRVAGMLETGPNASQLPYLRLRGRAARLCFGTPDPLNSGRGGLGEVDPAGPDDGEKE